MVFTCNFCIFFKKKNEKPCVHKQRESNKNGIGMKNM